MQSINKQTRIPFKTSLYLPFDEDYCFFSANNDENEFYLLLYSGKLNKIENLVQLPTYFKPISMCLNETHDKIIMISMRKGEQDLVPTDRFNYDILPYQEHYYYIISIDKFRVRFDGKMNRTIELDLINADKLNSNLMHIKRIRDNYFVCCTSNKVSFYELNEDENTFNQISDIPDIKLDGSEKHVLHKSMNTKLVKEEIDLLDTFGCLMKEEVLDIQ
jgi:hypothetical protein